MTLAGLTSLWNDPRSVGCLERAGQLQQYREHSLGFQGALAGHHFRQGGPFDEFHDQECQVVVLAEVVHGEHVGVTDLSQVRGLRSQQITRGDPGRRPRVEDLHGHSPLQPLVLRCPDLAHSS